MIKHSQPIPLENDNNPRVLPILLLQRLGDENPIRTLGDYSNLSHEGYRNTIELPVGNNMVPLRSDTIRLVQHGCSFHGLGSEDPNQHLKDFLKLVALLDLNSENRERTYFSFDTYLDELHVNWAHLEKKQMRLRTNIETLEDLCSQSLETASQAIHDTVTTHQVTVSQHFMMASARTDSNANLEDSTYDGNKKRVRTLVRLAAAGDDFRA
ncbi:hypothetical protein Tco_0317310 [Tanacetum coccineum]